MVKAPRQSSSPNAVSPDRLVDAALEVIETSGWRAATFGAIAGRLGVPVAQVLTVTPTRSDLLALVFRTVDRRMLSGVTAADEMEPHRDRLFDLIMRRLDVMTPYKRAIGSVMRAALRDPVTALMLSAQVRRSGQMILEAAGISTRGLWGELRIQGLAAIFLAVLRTWRNDDTPDLAPTMKTLDKMLDRVEGAEHFACSLVPSSGRSRRWGGRDREDTEPTTSSKAPGRTPDGPQPGSEPA